MNAIKNISFIDFFIAFGLSTGLFLLIFIPIVGFEQGLAVTLFGMYINIAKVAMSLILVMHIKNHDVFKLFSFLSLGFFVLSFFDFSLNKIIALSIISIGILCIAIGKFVQSKKH